jgi:hypothetical protein
MSSSLGSLRYGVLGRESSLDVDANDHARFLLGGNVAEDFVSGVVLLLFDAMLTRL